MTRKLNIRSAISLLLFAVLGAGCATTKGTPYSSLTISPKSATTERLLEESPLPKPSWVMQPPPLQSGDSLLFVAESGLFQQKNAARDDAMRRANLIFARHCGVDVSGLESYLSEGVAKSSEIMDTTDRVVSVSTMRTKATVSRVKDVEWYEQKVEQLMGETVLERGWRVWVLASVPTDEVEKVKAYRLNLERAEKEKGAGPCIEQYGRAYEGLRAGDGLVARNAPLEALAAYLDALDVYEKAVAMPEFEIARHGIAERGMEIPLPIQQRIQELLAEVKIEANTTVFSHLLGEEFAQSLVAKIAFRGTPMKGATVSLKGQGKEVEIISNADGVAVWQPEDGTSWPESNRSYSATLNHKALVRAQGRFITPQPVSFQILVRAMDEQAIKAHNDAEFARIAQEVEVAIEHNSGTKVSVMPVFLSGGPTRFGKEMTSLLETALVGRPKIAVVGRQSPTGAGGIAPFDLMLVSTAEIIGQKANLDCKVVRVADAVLLASMSSKFILSEGLRKAIGQQLNEENEFSAGVKVEFFSGRKGVAGTQPMTQGMPLRTGTRYGVSFTAPQETFVYLYQVDNEGKVYPFFPNSDYSSFSNPPPTGIKVTLPGERTYFELGEGVGAEEMVVVSSRYELIAVENVFQKIRQSQRLETSADKSGRRRLVGQADAAILAQALEILSKVDFARVVRMKFMHE